MQFSASDIAIICSILGLWLASFALALVNPLLFMLAETTRRAKRWHFAIWAVYVSADLIVLGHGFDNMNNKAWLIPVLAIPTLTIPHFIALLWIRWRARSKKQEINNDADGGVTPQKIFAPPVYRQSIRIALSTQIAAILLAVFVYNGSLLANVLFGSFTFWIGVIVLANFRSRPGKVELVAVRFGPLVVFGVAFVADQFALPNNW